MNSSLKKGAYVSGILAVGVTLSLPFRQHPSPFPPTSTHRQDELALRVSSKGSARPVTASVSTTANPNPAAKPQLTKSAKSMALPPRMAASFGEATERPHTNAPPPIVPFREIQGVHVDDTRQRRPLRKHRVVDGDSLESLAQRYLGDAARANEIFDANRDVLESPDLLPLKVKLTIPRRD